MAPASAAAAIDASLIERVLIHGDLRQLTPAQKVSYYNSVCQSVGLNPLTQPFAYLVLNNREVLYAKREATEQLRFIHSVSIDPKNFSREVIEGVYVVTASASLPAGRTDVSTGAVSIEGLKGESRANAMMKAETKAKRRVTLSICGLGMLDETEVESIPGAVVIDSPAAQTPAAAQRVASSAGDIGATPDREPGDDDELPAGALLVTSVEVTPTKNPNVKKALINFSDGRVRSTINTALINSAEQAREGRMPVFVTDAKSKWGWDLVKLERAS